MLVLVLVLVMVLALVLVLLMVCVCCCCLKEREEICVGLWQVSRLRSRSLKRSYVKAFVFKILIMKRLLHSGGRLCEPQVAESEAKR